MSANEARGTGKSVKVGPFPGEAAEDTAAENDAGRGDVRERAKEKAGRLKDRVGEQAGQTAEVAKAAKAKAAQAGEQVRETVGDLTGKAREVVTSEETGPKARRSGAGAAAVVAALVAVWAWRRRARRNASTWTKATRRARSQAGTVGREVTSMTEARAKARSLR